MNNLQKVQQSLDTQRTQVHTRQKSYCFKQERNPWEVGKQRLNNKINNKIKIKIFNLFNEVNEVKFLCLCYISSLFNNYYINWIIWLSIYKAFLSFLAALNAGILNNPGSRYIPSGYIIDNPKLIRVSLIRCIWVLVYIQQNDDM